MNKLTIAALLGALLATPALAGQFYKWTDEQGVTHYTQDPPPSTAKGTAEVKVQTRAPSGTEAAIQNLQKQREAATKAMTEGQKDKEQASTAPAKADKAQYADRCKKLKANLETMESHGRVTELDEKGEKRVLPEEEKAKRIDDTKRQIKAFCD